MKRPKFQVSLIFSILEKLKFGAHSLLPFSSFEELDLMLLMS